MKKLIIISLLIAMLSLSGCQEIADEKTDEILLGSSCGTVTPGYNDECCARKMADEATPACDGTWVYDFEIAECKFACNAEKEAFCGSSTEFPCEEDKDCNALGCSSQVCGGKNEEVMTTCEFKTCYDAASYGLRCGCFNSMCMWD